MSGGPTGGPKGGFGKWRLVAAGAEGENDAVVANAANDEPTATSADEVSSPPPLKATSNRVDIRTAIVEVALRAAVSRADRRRALSGQRPLAIVIRVPSAAWVRPVDIYLQNLGRKWTIFTRSGSIKLEKPDYENDVAASALAKNRTTIGIAVDPDNQLPRTLTAAADIVMTVGFPTAVTVARVLRRRFPGRSVTVPDGAVFGLDLDDIVAAIRPGGNAADAVALLRRASHRRRSGDDVGHAPDLHGAVEYGDARLVGLELVRDMIDYRAGRLAWADAMKGAMFFGPPGTGKTILASAIARAAGVPLLKFSVGGLFGRDAHLGTVMAELRDAFAQAASLSPCYMFWDEAEGLPARKTLDPRGRDWWMPIIDSFLLMTDAGVGEGGPGAERGRAAGIMLLGATNELQLVEPALLRPGRFERTVEIGHPDVPGIENILRFHLKDSLRDFDFTDVARMLEGSTAAEVGDAVRSARRSARHAGLPLTLGDLEAAAGGDVEHSAALRWRLAVHEGGHAVAVAVTAAGTLIHVSIHSRGRAGGHTRVADADDDLPTLETVERKVVALLAGEAAEALILGASSTGSGGSTDRSDLGHVSKVLSRIYATTSLTGDLFHQADEGDAHAAARKDPDTRRRIEMHLRELRRRADGVIGRNRDRVVAVATALLERRHLSAAAVVEILSTVPENDEDAAAQTPKNTIFQTVNGSI